MAWFKRTKVGLSTNKKKDIPEGLWLKCDGCGDIVYKPEIQKNLGVCTKCQYHFKISSIDYIEYLLDKGSFQEFDNELKTADPLKFKDNKKYADRIKLAKKSTGLTEAIRTGYGKMNGSTVVIGVMDFSFIGGSMGSVVGEKVKRSVDRAIETGFPLIIVSFMHGIGTFSS